MNTTYIAQAMRTNSTVAGLNQEVSADLIHATLGLCDENFEYNMAKSWLNAMEELGDLCWFVALASHELGCDPFSDWETYIDSHPNSPLMVEALAEFVGLVKKSFAYQNALPYPRLRELLRVIAGRAAKIIVSRSDMTPDELLIGNIEKLRARFPEKFEVDMALNRDLKQEADAMRAVMH